MLRALFQLASVYYLHENSMMWLAVIGYELSYVVISRFVLFRQLCDISSYLLIF